MQVMDEKAQLTAEGKDPASDEEIARRLQQQLNGEAAAAARRRTRKQPTFYSPQQSGGYSGYHGVEYASMDGEGREGEYAQEADHAAGQSPTARRADADAGPLAAGPPAKRGQPEPTSPRAVKEEDGMGPAKGSNSLSGRELRALMRSHQEKDVGLQDNKPGSTKGSSGRAVDSGAASGSGGDGEAGTEEVGTPRTSARRLKGKRQRSNLGQPQIKDEPGLKSKESGVSSMDNGESNSDNDDQSHDDPFGAPAKRRMRKIPKLPMVRHGKKWYRARLLKDSGQRVQIEFTGFEEASGSISLARESDRIWRGSYKGKDWRYLGEGAWEPKERASKKVAQRSSNLQKANSRPTSSNAHAQQSSDAPSSAEGVPPVNDPDAHGREAQSPRMKEPHMEAAASAVADLPEEQPAQRKQPQKRAPAEKADRGVSAKKAPLKPLDTEDIPPPEAASPAEEQALSAGAVKPETPAKGMESKPAPGDAGTDSGTDDDTKLLSAAERELRAHRKRKTGAQKLKQAAPEGASEAAEDMPATKRAHRAVPEPANADEQKVTAVATAAKEAAAEEAATGEAAAMLASMASEEQGDETGLHCEEALPAEDQAGKSLAGSPCQPSPQVRSAEQHLGWKFAWKKSHKKQADGVSSDSGDKASARCPEPTMSPKSLRPARRTRKPLKIDNPYAEIEASRQATPVAAPSAPDVPMRSPFATPPDSEDEKEPEVRAPSSGRGRGGRRGGRAAQRGGRGRGGGRWAHHRAALAAAAALNGAAAEDASGGEGLHDAGSGVQPALAQRPVRTLKPSSKILAANHNNHSPSPPPTRRGRSASAGPNTIPQPASRGLLAFSGLMDAMSALDGPRASATGRLSNTSSQSWDSRSAPAAAAQVAALPVAWPAASLVSGGAPLFGGLDARWRFNAHRKILEASEKLMPAQQPSSPGILTESIVHPHPPPVPLFQ